MMPFPLLCLLLPCWLFGQGVMQVGEGFAHTPLTPVMAFIPDAAANRTHAEVMQMLESKVLPPLGKPLFSTYFTPFRYFLAFRVVNTGDQPMPVYVEVPAPYFDLVYLPTSMALALEWVADE